MEALAWVLRVRRASRERERGNKQKDLCRREHTGILYSLSYTMSLREREESLESLVVEETLGLKRV